MPMGKMILSAPKKSYPPKSKSVSKIAKGNDSNIQTLAKAVKRLQKANVKEAEYLNLTNNFSFVNAVTPALYQSLSNYNSMSGTFGASTDDFSDNAIIHKSVAMDIRVSLENTINNEENTIGFTCFLVSLKDDIGDTFNSTNGVLNLANGVTHQEVQGMVLLNKKMFNIHKTKRFTLTNHGTVLTQPAAQSQYGSDMRFSWYQRINKKISNPVGNWKSLQTANDPSKQYYVLVFTDNTTADLESPTVSLVAVHTFKTVQ